MMKITFQEPLHPNPSGLTSAISSSESPVSAALPGEGASVQSERVLNASNIYLIEEREGVPLRIGNLALVALRIKESESGRIDQDKLPEFLCDIPFYEINSSLCQSQAIRQVISNCIEKSLGLKTENFHIKMIGGSGTKGVSGSPVYLIFDHAGTKLIAVLKLLPKVVELPEELCAIEFLRTLNLEKTNIISILGVGRTKIDNHEYGIVIQSVASGKALDDLMEDVVSSSEKESAMKLLCEAMASTGGTLAQIHEQTLSKKVQSSFEINSHIKAVVDVTNKLNKKISEGNPYLVGSLQIKDLDSLLKKMGTSYIQNPGFGAVAHLDAHVGNFFYFQETGYVTPIDISSLSRSFSSEGEGLVSPARDYSYFRKKLHVFGLEKGMNREALVRADNSFKIGYNGCLKQGAVMTNEAALFFEYRTILLFLKRYIDDIEDLDVGSSEYQKKVLCINHMIEELKSMA